MVWEREILLPCKNRQELRDWLLANNTTEKSCWIFASVKPQPDTILYLYAVEEGAFEIYSVDEEQSETVVNSGVFLEWINAIKKRRMACQCKTLCILVN